MCSVIVTTDSYEDLIYVVCDASSVGGRRATRLLDVYDSLEWRSAVTEANCHSELFLVESTYDEFLSFSNAEVLSYRWSEVITVYCGVREPGSGDLSEPRESEISLDIFRKLKDLHESYLWVDYLSHLNNQLHKHAVMRRMGSLYLSGNVFPLYLQDFSTSTSRFDFYCDLFSDKKILADVQLQFHELQSLVKEKKWIDDRIEIALEQIETLRIENPSEVAYLVGSVVENLGHSDSDLTLQYILRFLERSYPKMHDLHNLFVDKISMLPESKALLALRRGWIQQEISFGRLPADVVKSFIEECIRRSKFALLGTFIRRRHKAIAAIMDHSLESDASAHPCEKQIGASMFSCFNVADLHDQETPKETEFSLKIRRDVVMNPSIFHGSPPASKTKPSAIQNYLESMIRLLEGIELELFVDKLTSSSCEPNTFDPTNFYSAYQLLRSFAESKLTYENDAYFAMIECAAISYGIPIHHLAIANGESMADPFSEIFKICWNTLLNTHYKVSGEMFSFSMSRTQPQEWALGMRALYPLLAKAAHQQKSDFVVKISDCPVKDTKNIYLIFQFHVKTNSISDLLVFKEKVPPEKEHEREADFVILYESFSELFNV